MFLKEQTITSKKNGKEYKGFSVVIGEYETPMFFPSRVEALYLENYNKDKAHEEFNASAD